MEPSTQEAPPFAVPCLLGPFFRGELLSTLVLQHFFLLNFFFVFVIGCSDESAKGELVMDVQGMMIGNGWIDPVSQV